MNWFQIFSCSTTTHKFKVGICIWFAWFVREIRNHIIKMWLIVSNSHTRRNRKFQVVSDSWFLRWYDVFNLRKMCENKRPVNRGNQVKIAISAYKSLICPPFFRLFCRFRKLVTFWWETFDFDISVQALAKSKNHAFHLLVKCQLYFHRIATHHCCNRRYRWL